MSLYHCSLSRITKTSGLSVCPTCVARVQTLPKELHICQTVAPAVVDLQWLPRELHAPLPGGPSPGSDTTRVLRV